MWGLVIELGIHMYVNLQKKIPKGALAFLSFCFLAFHAKNQFLFFHTVIILSGNSGDPWFGDTTVTIKSDIIIAHLIVYCIEGKPT